MYYLITQQLINMEKLKLNKHGIKLNQKLELPRIV